MEHVGLIKIDSFNDFSRNVPLFRACGYKMDIHEIINRKNSMIIRKKYGFKLAFLNGYFLHYKTLTAFKD